MQHTLLHRRHVRTIAFVLRTIEQRSVALLLIGIVLLAVLYIYFLGSAVVHVVERRETQHMTANVSSHVATLEEEYFEVKSTITDTLDTEMNFTTLAQKDYVRREQYLGRANTY